MTPERSLAQQDVYGMIALKDGARRCRHLWDAPRDAMGVGVTVSGRGEHSSQSKPQAPCRVDNGTAERKELRGVGTDEH